MVFFRLFGVKLHGEMVVIGQAQALPTELPSQDRGTWVVRPDGTMQTTWHIRPGVTWQDGQPLKASDFLFAWTVTLDKELPISQQTIARQVSRLETPDDLTLVMEWSRLYPFANAIIEGAESGAAEAMQEHLQWAMQRERTVQNLDIADVSAT